MALPDTYKQIEYIESSGDGSGTGQYINTGISIENGVSLKVEIDFHWLNNTTSERDIFGYYQGQYNDYLIGFNTGTFNTVLNSHTIGTLPSTWTPSTYSTNTRYNVVAEGTTVSSSNTPYLFAQNENGTDNWDISAKLYSCKIWKDNLLVRDYVPVLRLSDKKPGLYDLVNDVFYTNSGKGEFTYPAQNGPVKKIYIRVSNPELRGLPSEYQQVDYIESSGTQYINTGYTPNVNTEIETELSWGSSQTAWGAFFGVTSNDQWNDGVLGRIYNTSTTIFNPWFCNTAYDQCQITTTTDAFHKVILKKNYCTLDGTAGTLTTTGTPYQDNIYLFCGNNGGSAWRHTSVKFRSFKISESGVLVRDFVPCYRKQDSVIGLYDLVNDQFYTNSGTGTFTQGSNIADLIEKQVRPVSKKLPDTYQEVEYIQSNGGPYLNLGSFGDVLGGWELKLNPLSLRTTYEAYLGNGGGRPATGKLQGRSSGIYFQGQGPNGGYEGTIGALNTTQVISFDSTGLKTDGVVKSSITPGNWGSGNVWIFNNSGESSYYSTMQLYYVKIWAGGTLVRDCIPCYRKSDSVIGAYDLVNDVFYTNVGSGTFVKGPDVN